MFIDSHCHLDFPDFENRLPEILETMEKQLVTLANQILEELNSGKRQPDWDHLRNYKNLSDQFKDWRTDSGEDFREELSFKMDGTWPQKKIDAFVDGSCSPTEEDLEEFAEATQIDMDIYAYIELRQAGSTIGWAVFQYEHCNDQPYEKNIRFLI